MAQNHWIRAALAALARGAAAQARAASSAAGSAASSGTGIPQAALPPADGSAHPGDAPRVNQGTSLAQPGWYTVSPLTPSQPVHRPALVARELGEPRWYAVNG